MNNTLDFNRLGKVIRRDGMNYIPNFGWSLVILWAIPLVIWLISFAFAQYGGEVTSRAGFLGFLSTIALIIAPAKLYKDCNDSRKGIQYAMMPASTLEKFLSMFLYCVIVTPIVYIVGAVAIDTILALFPGKNPYGCFIFKSFFNPIAQSKELAESMGGYTEFYDEFASIFSTFSIVMSKILTVITTASIFMFGNMIFKKRKTSKMIGILVLIFIFLMIVFIKWTVNYEGKMFDAPNEEFKEEYFTNLVTTAIYAIWVLDAIISAIMLGLTYYKIKTQKY